MRKINILAKPPGATDGTQWYRAAGPLGEMQKHDQVDVRYMTELNWGDIKAADYLFLLRPCSDSDLYIAEMAKNLGTRVWVDFDDLLNEVPTDNPVHGYYENPRVQRNMECCIHMADVVTVSTKFLKTKLAKYSNKIWVVSNAVDPNLMRLKPKKAHSADIVAWRGTSTHMRDLMAYSEAIHEVSKKADSMFAFVGYNPWFLKERIGPKAIHIPNVELLQYHEALCALNPRILYVPLDDSDFNRCKSNIAALEGSLAGAAILAPQWEEWDLPGVIHYTDQADFKAKLETMIEEKDLSVIRDQTWDHVAEFCNLEQQNNVRYMALQGSL